MHGKTHFELASVENVAATLTITATVAEWRLLMEGAELYKAGSEEWYRWAATSVLGSFISEIRAMLKDAEDAHLSCARKIGMVLDGSFEPEKRWKHLD